MMTFDLNSLLSRLEAMSDESYRRFNEGLIPGAQNTSLGVRIPILRVVSRNILSGDWQSFLEVSRSHPVHEIRMLHGMVLGGACCAMVDKLPYIESFLPNIDNWALCDTFCACLKPAAKDMNVLFEYVCLCADASDEYRKRFGLIMMMDYFRSAPYIDRVMSAYRSFSHTGYYARMGAAWGLATLFIDHRECVLALLRDGVWDDFTHN